jgi:hypothetical protein
VKAVKAQKLFSTWENSALAWAFIGEKLALTRVQLSLCQAQFAQADADRTKESNPWKWGWVPWPGYSSSSLCRRSCNPIHHNSNAHQLFSRGELSSDDKLWSSWTSIIRQALRKGTYSCSLNREPLERS